MFKKLVGVLLLVYCLLPVVQAQGGEGSIQETAFETGITTDTVQILNEMNFFSGTGRLRTTCTQ